MLRSYNLFCSPLQENIKFFEVYRKFNFNDRRRERVYLISITGHYYKITICLFNELNKPKSGAKGKDRALNELTKEIVDTC